jgi:hypothetical protein
MMDLCSTIITRFERMDLLYKSINYRAGKNNLGFMHIWLILLIRHDF